MKRAVSLSMQKRITSSPDLLAMDEGIISAIASIIEKRCYPTEILLDFLWLLFTKASLVGNIDGFVSQIERAFRISLPFLQSYSGFVQSCIPCELQAASFS